MPDNVIARPADDAWRADGWKHKFDNRLTAAVRADMLKTWDLDAHLLHTRINLGFLMQYRALTTIRRVAVTASQITVANSRSLLTGHSLDRAEGMQRGKYVVVALLTPPASSFRNEAG